MTYGLTRQTWATEQLKRRRNTDWPMLLATLALLVVGGMALVSADLDAARRQLAFAAVGATLGIAACCLDYRLWSKAAWPLYLLSLALLGLVLVFGHTANGAQRWIGVGELRFQPSELAKLALVVALARVLAPGAGWGRMFWALACTGLMFVLIALQPDLGTALVLGAIALVMLFVAGASPVGLLGLVTAGLAVLPYTLKEYQKNRLLVFMHPELDPRGMGYSIAQSKTAIGSGGLNGKGWLGGHMNQNGFVPENWTDFIFSVIGEEMGFLGCAGFLALAVLLSLCLLRAALCQQDRFGSLLCTGMWAMLVFQFLVNMGMTTGVAPVVGIPLPFASYGGSALIVNLLGVGIAASSSARARRAGNQLGLFSERASA